jgi:hypothetical protein
LGVSALARASAPFARGLAFGFLFLAYGNPHDMDGIADYIGLRFWPWGPLCIGHGFHMWARPETFLE